MSPPCNRHRRASEPSGRTHARIWQGCPVDLQWAPHSGRRCFVGTIISGMITDMAKAKKPRLTAADRLLVAGVAGTIVIGGALYLFRDNIAAQYELRLHPERYWAAELDHRSFVLKMSAIQHEECLVDLLAARMKEPAKVARMKLIGMDEGGALKLARDESAAQEEVCKVLADMVKQDRASVATTEREVARAR